MSPSHRVVDQADDGGAEQKGDETMARDYRAVKIADRVHSRKTNFMMAPSNAFVKAS